MLFPSYQAETLACQKTAEFIPDFHDRIWGGSAISSAIPKGYGAVILVNVIGASLALVTLSFKVSAARKEYNCLLYTSDAADE